MENPFAVVYPNCICKTIPAMWIKQTNKCQIKNTGINFLSNDFLIAKFLLKIFGKYLKKLLKVLAFSKYL